MLARKLMLSLVADFQQNKPLVLNPKFVHGLKSILLDSSLDKVFMKQCFFSQNRILDFFFPLFGFYALHQLELFSIQEFIAKAITLPGEGEIMDIMEVADPDAVHAVRSFIRKQLASELKAELLSTVCYLPRSNYFLFPLRY